MVIKVFDLSKTHRMSSEYKVALFRKDFIELRPRYYSIVPQTLFHYITMVHGTLYTVY